MTNTQAAIVGLGAPILGVLFVLFFRTILRWLDNEEYKR